MTVTSAHRRPEKRLPALERLGRLPRASRTALRETLPVIRIAQTLLVTAFAVGTFAHADPTFVFSGSVGGTSDFVFRGLSLTRGKPALQASLDVEFPREFYVGVFAATADPNVGPGPTMEMDFWAGRYFRVSDHFSGDLRISQYTYPDDPRRVAYDRTELTATLGFRNQLFVAAIYSPNTHAIGSSAGYAEGDVWAVELSGRQPLNERLSVSAGIGHYGLDDIYHDGINYWNATLTAALHPFELQLAYLGIESSAERHFIKSSVGNRVALTALWRFSATQ
jgi:uncharacterized protein (TIGR02001 family)